jgi:hypothetical protein
VDNSNLSEGQKRLLGSTEILLYSISDFVRVWCRDRNFYTVEDELEHYKAMAEIWADKALTLSTDLMSAFEGIEDWGDLEELVMPFDTKEDHSGQS